MLRQQHIVRSALSLRRTAELAPCVILRQSRDIDRLKKTNAFYT